MINFVKMHGTGNDFVIIDCRSENFNINAKKIANRKTGIGCDQLVVLRKSNIATALMLIYNIDGSRAETCGNAARCVVELLISRSGESTASLELVNGQIINGERVMNGQIKINMGCPMYKWHQIPLSTECDTLNLPLQVESLSAPVAVNIGNPHVIFFVDNIEDIIFEKLAPQIETHSLFPNRVNVSIAQVTGDNEIKVRVWERGVGITESCGSAACAVLLAAIRKNYIKGTQATINLPGGKLQIQFDGCNVFMTGEVTYVFKGVYFG